MKISLKPLQPILLIVIIISVYLEILKVWKDIDEEVSRKLRLERHKNEVRLGKKDAQYYVDNEVRISADPNWQPKMEVSEAYKDGWNRIFNKP